MNRLFYILVFVLILFPLVKAQDKLQIEPDQRFLILSTLKTSTMQKELDEASAKGFRVMFSGGGEGLLIYLERSEQVTESRRYRLLAASKVSTLEKEVAEAAKEGFYVLPRTITLNLAALFMFEMVVIMEQDPKSNKRFEYELFGKRKLSNLQKEIVEAQKKGYTFVGAIGGVAFMEREAQSK